MNPQMPTGNETTMHPRLVFIVILLAACGDDSSADSGADAALDSSAFDSAFDSTVDAPAPRDAETDASFDAALDGGGVDGGGECGTGEDDVGWRVPRTCLEARCMDHPTCEEADLVAAGYEDHELCGMMDITPASSAEACMVEPPFGPFPESPPYNCGPVRYEGRVRFYCNADRTSVAARFVATHTDEGGGFSEYFGHEFWAGSGGGSGDSRSYSDYIDIGSTRFFGWQQVSLDPGTSTQLQVWFMSGSFIDPEIGMSYTGGFTAMVPPSE